jgi:hypothetical protein
MTVEEMEQRIKQLRSGQQELHKLLRECNTRPWWNGCARAMTEELCGKQLHVDSTLQINGVKVSD